MYIRAREPESIILRGRYGDEGVVHAVNRLLALDCDCVALFLLMGHSAFTVGLIQTCAPILIFIHLAKLTIGRRIESDLVLDFQDVR